MIFQTGILENDLEISGLGLVEGHYIDPDSIVIVGNIGANELVSTQLLIESGLIIRDADGNDVTRNYYISFVSGKMEITR